LMKETSAEPRLIDIVDTIERIRSVTHGVSLDAFVADWQKQWVVERGIEIISEASRRLSEDLKARHPEIQWKQIAGIGNVLRHEYERISAPILWKVVQHDLDPLEDVCRIELKIIEPPAKSDKP